PPSWGDDDDAGSFAAPFARAELDPLPPELAAEGTRTKLGAAPAPILAARPTRAWLHALAAAATQPAPYVVPPPPRGARAPRPPRARPPRPRGAEAVPAPPHPTRRGGVPTPMPRVLSAPQTPRDPIPGGAKPPPIPRAKTQPPPIPRVAAAPPPIPEP